MAFSLRSRGAQADAEQASSAMKADRPLWLNGAKDQVVEGGSQEAAFLFAPHGEPIQPAEANRYGLRFVDGVVVLPNTPTPTPVAETPPPSPAEPPPPSPSSESLEPPAP